MYAHLLLKLLVLGVLLLLVVVDFFLRLVDCALTSQSAFQLPVAQGGVVAAEPKAFFVAINDLRRLAVLQVLVVLVLLRPTQFEPSCIPPLVLAASRSRLDVRALIAVVRSRG